MFDEAIILTIKMAKLLKVSEFQEVILITL